MAYTLSCYAIDEDGGRDLQPRQLSSKSIEPVPGAYAMNLPAPIYIMAGEEEEEPIPRELLQPSPQTQSPRPEEASSTVLMGDVVLDAKVEAVKQIDKADDKQEDESSYCARNRLCITVIALTAIIAVVVAVVAAVMVAGGSDDDVGPFPTPAPTWAPTMEENAENTWEECYRTTRSLMNALARRIDYTDFIDVKLCPRVKFRVDVVDEEKSFFGAYPAISAQPNMRIKCGEEGRLDDRCVLYDGDTLFVNALGFQRQANVYNLTLEGLTFETGRDSLVLLRNGGDITFRNCLFRVRWIEEA